MSNWFGSIHILIRLLYMLARALANACRRLRRFVILQQRHLLRTKQRHDCADHFHTRPLLQLQLALSCLRRCFQKVNISYEKNVFMTKTNTEDFS